MTAEAVTGDVVAMSYLQTADISNMDNMDLMKIAYAGALVGVVALVIGIFINRGPMVVTGILAYLLSLSTMTLTVKSVFKQHQFNYPKFVTSTHFLSCGILCFGIMAYRQIKGEKKIPIPSI